MKFLFVTNDAWFFVSHRLPIAIEVVESGHSAGVVALQDAKVEKIKQVGLDFYPWRVSPRGKNPVAEFLTILSLARVLLRVRPDVVHLVTIKPILYGGVLCRLFRVPAVVYAVSGLGSMIHGTQTSNNGGDAETIRSRLGLPAQARKYVLWLYRRAINHHNSIVIFQNQDDQEKLLRSLKVPSLRTALVRGSGVDLGKFAYLPEPSTSPCKIVLAARLLRDKGISEFVEAAEILQHRGVAARFVVAGDEVAQGNPSEYSAAELEKLRATEGVDFVGHCEDIAQLYISSNIVVLPSYHEGMPKSLLEAAACGRAVVTTDVSGCRYAIEPGITGVLVPVRDSIALANAIENLINDKQKREAMGLAGRKLAETAFSMDLIVQQHIDIYRTVAEGF